MSETTGPAEFGRVDADGTVYVRTADGERRVGQVPDVDPAEAMAFFVRRFDALNTEVGLLERRVASGSLSPDEARKNVSAVRKSLAGANAVGDLAGLEARLDALKPVLAELAEARRAEKAKQHEATKASKEAMVAEAEKIAAGTDWRGGVNRFRALLEEWKALPRIDRATDDELWHRFSSARTTYTRRRKAQFADRAEKRDEARKVKDEIIEEARELAGSTDWGVTAGAFRDLMTRWKAAGAAARDVDDKLWTEFRGLQDQFFDARNAAFDEQDAEFKQNQVAKEALLNEAEARLLPVTDVAQARAGLRDFLNRYNEHGKVPRDAIRPLDNRVRALEQAIKEAEEAEWRRTDPEARHRAEETVAMFSQQIAKLQKQATEAEGKGNSKKAKELQASIGAYTEWLEQARKTLSEFTA